MVSCRHCQRDRCLWYTYEDEIVEGIDDWLHGMGEETTNNLIRKHCYRLFIEAHHGYLGQGNRKKIPCCILRGIRTLYPDPNGSYMGHRDS